MICACNSVGTEKLPDEDTCAPNHVGAVECGKELSEEVYLLVICKYIPVLMFVWQISALYSQVTTGWSGEVD
jgi:hypothetical protein